jgi:hypothetical protein
MSAPAKKKLTWLIKAAPGETIHVICTQEKAGTAEAEITL